VGTRVVVQFFQLAFLTRLLGNATDFGLFALINVVIVLGQAFGDVGISKAIIHYQDTSRRELSSLYWLNLAAGVAVFAIIIALSGFLTSLDPRITDPLRLAAVVFLIVPVGQQFQVLLERELAFRRISIIETVAFVVGAVVSVLCAWRGKGVHSLVWGMVAGASTKALLLAAAGWRSWRPSLHFRLSECRRYVRFGAFQIGERMVNALGQQLDKILIGALMGPEQLGFYDLAYRLMIRPYQLISPMFTRVAFPLFSKVQDDFDRLRKGFLEMIGVLGALTAPLYAGMIALAEPIVLVQMGSGYEPCIPLLRILSLLGFLYSIGSPMGSILLARGRADVAFYINVLRTLLLAGAVVVGAQFGLEGIAWSLVITVVCVQGSLGFWVRWRLIGLRVMPYLATLGGGVLVAVLVGGAAWVAATRIDWPGNIVLLAVVLPLAAATYALLGRWWFPRRAAQIVTTIRS